MRRTLATVAVAMLALAGCSANDGETTQDTPEETAPEATAEEPDSGGEGSTGGVEPAVDVGLDGQPLDFSEIHCAASPGNDGQMRLFAIYPEGEITIDAKDSGGIEIVLETGDEPTYYSREDNNIDFATGSAQGEVEVSNSDDDIITVTMDLAC